MGVKASGEREERVRVNKLTDCTVHTHEILKEQIDFKVQIYSSSTLLPEMDKRM